MFRKPVAKKVHYTIYTGRHAKLQTSKNEY